MKIVPDKQPGAKDVETQYETVAVSGRLALLKVRLITGRTHRIRAHMAASAAPSWATANTATTPPTGSLS